MKKTRILALILTLVMLVSLLLAAAGSFLK